MRSRFLPPLPGLAVLLGVATLALAVHLAQAQYPHPGQNPPGYCPPGYAPAPYPQAAPQRPAQPTQPSQQGQPSQQAQPSQQGQQAQTSPQGQQPSPSGDTGNQGADQAGADSSFGPEASAAGGGETVAMSAPNVIGDLISSSFLRCRFGATQVAALPLQARAAFKIAENESPKPCDRVFFNFNYFSEVNTNLVQPSAVARPNLYREVFGFEKTFLGGDASVGVRVPLFQMGGASGINIDSWGDISFILKYAIINNCCTGNVLSTGVVITAPTGGKLANSAFCPDEIHTTYFQPYVGWIYNYCDWFAQGFSSCLIPGDKNDATVLFNDVAVGYWLYVAPDCRFRSSNAFAEKGITGCWHDPTTNAFSDGGYIPCCCGRSFISALIPTVEAHAVTPLDHRHINATDEVFTVDSLVLTGGLHIQFLNTADLMVGVASPVTGPRPYDFEVICQLNVKF